MKTDYDFILNVTNIRYILNNCIKNTYLSSIDYFEFENDM